MLHQRLLSYIFILLIPSIVLLAVGERTASIHEVQPALADTVHAVWLNGPSHSGKVGGFPTFGDATGNTGTKCTQRDDELYTGYDANGNYCEQASTALNDQAHLLIHSGRLGIVFDAGGLKAAASSGTRNLLPKLGAVPKEVSEGTSREVYDALPANTETSITLTLSGCSSATDDATYTLGAPDNAFVQAGLVRHGHAVTQVTLSGLEFQSASDGSVYGPCSTFVSEKDPLSQNCNCNTCGSWPCVGTNPNGPVDRSPYTDCRGFVQGNSWGRCWTVCTAEGSNNVWGELSVWGDSIAFEIAWDAAFTLPAGDDSDDNDNDDNLYDDNDEDESGENADAAADDDNYDCNDTHGDAALTLPSAGCTGTVAVSLLGGAHSASASAAAAGRVSVVLTAPIAGGSSLVATSPPANPVEVSSPTGTVLIRETTMDVFVEVPSTLPRCGYNLDCANKPLTLVDIVLSNPDPADEQTVRLSFSRNFETRDSSLTQSGTGSEITGLSVQVRVCVGGCVLMMGGLTRGMHAQLWNATSKQATGIPIQV